MNAALVERIKNCPRLPSLPALAIQVLALAQRPNADISAIAEIVTNDPALCGRLLKTVNSSFYGRAQAVSSINQALVILGLQSVKTLVLGFSLVTNLSKSKPGAFNHLDYWRRSIYTATAARTLAHKLGVVQQEEAFLAGLLCDIGMLALDATLGAEYASILTQANGHADLVRQEQQSLQMTHADVGGILAEMWKLPALLQVPVTFSHRSQEVSDPALKKLAEIVEIATWCGDIFVNPEPASSIALVRQRFASHFQLSGPQCDQILEEIGKGTKEMASLFEINLGQAQDYEKILKNASEALVEMTLQSQLQANALLERNAQLQEQANKDGLTKLANRPALDQFLAQQIALARQSGKPLTLLMLDLDKFKTINDTFGHAAGDAVLRRVAEVVRSAARPSDMVARYGGEEITMVLPNTTRATGTLIADTIRRCIAAQPIAHDQKQIPVTASIGVATAEPNTPMMDATLLMRAADMAVYAAKHGGRNCVKVFSLPPAPKLARVVGAA